MAADPNQHILFGQLDYPGEGEAGKQWNDGVYLGIHQIIVAYGDVAIDSIHIQYDNHGIPVWSELGAGKGILNSCRSEPRRRAGNQIEKIRLNYPREILTKISGRYDTYLRSLTFETNENKYGPYGSEQGNTFESPDGWKIVGFYGRSRSYLQKRNFSCFYCIGVSRSLFLQSVKPISVGRWGGDAGDRWDDGVYSGIHQIIIVYDEDGGAIGSIDIEYDNNGSRFWLGHGISAGNKIEKIQLDYPREILTSISGRYNARGIRSLTFTSNLNRKHGPYGGRGGTCFSIPNVKIVGFHGRSDEFLRCIGVHLTNLDIAERRMCVKVGPWGKGERGVLWDDGLHSGILRITVCLDDEDAIRSIRIEYDHHGGSVPVQHGDNNGQEYECEFKPGDIFNSISGYYDDTCVRRLTFGRINKPPITFHRNRISRLWTYFSIPIMDGKIVGLYGRSDEYLRCIGVYFSH